MRGAFRPQGRARYCSRKCRRAAYRLRYRPPATPAPRARLVTSASKGALSVKGKEAPLNLEITSAALAGNTLEIRAEATVDRYAYGVSAMKGMASWYLRLVLAIQATRS